MNENLNLVEILKDCPKGTKLYSPMFGEVEFEEAYNDVIYPIVVKTKNGNLESFTLDGRWDENYKGECLLFPSNEQRDWGKFRKIPKFDPRTLKSFDKVLVRDRYNEAWMCTLFSHIREEGTCHFVCSNMYCKYCIPYNDDTKHIVGTTEEAPEFYRYWED